MVLEEQYTKLKVVGVFFLVALYDLRVRSFVRDRHTLSV